jgi:Protein of unknown function (DUF1822)
MTNNLEFLTATSPHDFWVDFYDEALQKALPKDDDYSHETARFRALLNQLCISVLVPEIIQEFADRFRFKPTLTQPKYKLFKPERMLKHIWEVVNGTKIIVEGVEIVIIPTDNIDIEEFSVHREWVDIPGWNGDYYLAVQVNLDDGWLRVWGLTTYHKLKTEGRYDANYRTYSLDCEDLFENLNVLFLGNKFSPETKTEIPALPELSSSQVNNLLAQVSKPKSYSPRLQVAFEKWAELLVDDQRRQQMYNCRLGKKSNHITADRFSNLWLPISDLISANNLNLSAARSAKSTDDSPIILRGRIVDLGILLVNHPVALIVKATKEAENKYSIRLRLHPGRNQTFLPPDLQLVVLVGEEVVDEAKSRDALTMLKLQLEISGELGEEFRVTVALGDASVTEDFVI